MTTRLSVAISFLLLGAVGAHAQVRPSAAEVVNPTALLLVDGRACATLPPGMELAVLGERDGASTVLARGPAGTIVIGRVVTADLRATAPDLDISGWPALRNKPVGTGADSPRSARVKQQRTPLIDPASRMPCFDLLIDAPLLVFGDPDRAGKVRVALQGLSGWLEGLVDAAALGNPAPAGPVSGISGHLGGAGPLAPQVLPVPIPFPGPVRVGQGTVALFHGSEPYTGAVVVTDRGVSLFVRGPRELVDAQGQPYDPAAHGVDRYWLTQQGYTLDTALNETVLPGGAHLVRIPGQHGSAIKDLW